MPRQRARKQFLTFIGGLNTEASPLTFPENTAKSIDNMDLFRDGSLSRRRGIDFEVGGARSVDTFADSAGLIQNYGISVHEWESVGGDDSLNFAVIQIGPELFFHNLGEDVLSVGSSVIGKVNLTAISTDLRFDKVVISTISAKGRLFIVNRYTSPAYLEYDADTNSFKGFKLSLKIRDIDGIDEEVSTAPEFPTSAPEDETPPPISENLPAVQDILDGVLNSSGTFTSLDNWNIQFGNFINISGPGAGF